MPLSIRCPCKLHWPPSTFACKCLTYIVYLCPTCTYIPEHGIGVVHAPAKQIERGEPVKHPPAVQVYVTKDPACWLVLGFDAVPWTFRTPVGGADVQGLHGAVVLDGPNI